MTQPKPTEPGGLSEEINQRKLIILRELRERSYWFIKLRWWVPPAIIAASFTAHVLGVSWNATATLAVAGFILAYNAVFHFLWRELHKSEEDKPRSVQRFTYWQVGLDYLAMFLLIHFTGGAASPLIFFFIFHIIFASILLPPASAYGFAGLAAVGMALIAAAEYLGLIPHHALYYQGRAIDLAEQPFHMMVELSFFTASVFITAFSVTSIMAMLRKRIIRLAELSEAMGRLNDRFNSLFAMTQAVGSIRNLQKLFQIVTSELAAVMGVKAISVKLLSEDGKTLSYAAVHGLPESFRADRTVEVAKSPINRRVIEGDPFATGRLTHKDMFQFGEDLQKAEFQSVLFVPLTLEDRVIGILGAYCLRPDRFDDEEVDFFRLAAGLIAIALDNARTYEALEALIKERSWFMMKAAHNLRAPLAAIVSMIEVLRGGYHGKLSPDQEEYLRRMERRARTMISMIGELMDLAENRNERRTLKFGPIKPEFLAGRLERTFKDEALEKEIAFKITIAPGLPPINGDLEMIEQLMENLISNAIKYTPQSGKVSVAFVPAGEKTVRIEVADNGIGIPKEAMSQLFSEFFRADNARSIEEIGTGLGLAIVKEIVDQHRGRISVESEEGLGTIFYVDLPAAPKPEVK